MAVQRRAQKQANTWTKHAAAQNNSPGKVWEIFVFFPKHPKATNLRSDDAGDVSMEDLMTQELRPGVGDES